MNGPFKKLFQLDMKRFMLNGFMFVTSIWVQMCTDANWFGANLIVVNDQVLKNNPDIWSHRGTPKPTCGRVNSNDQDKKLFLKSFFLSFTLQSKAIQGTGQ